jgi:acid stress-induced BolA-like protein IbaG/YrbA
MNVEKIESQLKKMPAYDSIEVTGDGMHFQIKIVSTEFEGKNKLSRQRLVYNYLKEWLADGSLHAVELQTLTPSEVAKLNHE